MDTNQKAYIAGGCFWGMEDLFRTRPGVLDTEVGYLGGENDNPTYRNHPGHAEGIEITYDPNTTSFMEILDFFFRIHNPTTIDQQGNDRGSSYRSAIFFQISPPQRTQRSKQRSLRCTWPEIPQGPRLRDGKRRRICPPQ